MFDHSTFYAIAAGAAVAALLLLVAHVLLWPYQSQLHIVAKYTVGVACLNLGITLAAVLLADVRMALVVWAVSGTGGVVIASCWWLRGVIAQRREVRGEILELMDRARGRHGTGERGTEGD